MWLYEQILLELSSFYVSKHKILLFQQWLLVKTPASIQREAYKIYQMANPMQKMIKMEYEHMMPIKVC